MKCVKALVPAVIALAGCDPSPSGDISGSTTPPYERVAEEGARLDQTERPVRVGELGPAFAACTARGTTMRSSGTAGLAVRAAPFETAKEIDRLPAGAQFYICSRSLDQKWFGLVYDTGGALAERCGVSMPLPGRQDYPGPCLSGWVQSAAVRVTGR